MARKYFNSGACGRKWSAVLVSNGKIGWAGRTVATVVFMINDSPSCELNREQVVDLRNLLDDFLACNPVPPKGDPLFEGEF